MFSKYILVFIFFFGCISIKTLPNVNDVFENDFISKIEGKLEYSGNPEYLPKIIENNLMSTNLVIYDYSVSYEPANPSDLMAFFNPLIFLGFPIEEHKVILKGNLIYENGAKKIDSEVIISQYRILYNNPNYTEMRKIGLNELKKNIEFIYKKSSHSNRISK
ncbi:hypothetical protein AB3N60_11000 [Leptospira sp. WS39.C2]